MTIKKSLLQTVYKKLSKLIRLTPIVTAWLATFLLFLGIAYLSGALNILKHLTRDLTTTVSAATESLSFSLAKGTQSSWVLPPGVFLGPDKISDDPPCVEAPRENEFVPQEYFCTLTRNTRVVIDGAATITHEVTPTGDWSIVITKGDDPDANIQLQDGGNPELATYEEELRFSTSIGKAAANNDPSRKGPTSIRFPVIAATATVGDHIRYAAGIREEFGAFWQPTLLSGNIATYGLNRPDTGKYQILSERLDTGDIVDIDTKDRKFHMTPEDSIWGVVTIEDRTVLLSDTTETRQYVIYAVLHTTHRSLTVRRFGAGDGHEIKASGWSIISRWPNGQMTWVIFVSFILVLTFILQLTEALQHKSLKSKKKGKKHKNRKRTGD